MIGVTILACFPLVTIVSPTSVVTRRVLNTSSSEGFWFTL